MIINAANNDINKANRKKERNWPINSETTQRKGKLP